MALDETRSVCTLGGEFLQDCSNYELFSQLSWAFCGTWRSTWGNSAKVWILLITCSFFYWDTLLLQRNQITEADPDSADLSLEKSKTWLYMAP